MGESWSKKRVDAARVAEIARGASLSPAAATLLALRGHGGPGADPDALQRHLRASPMDLHDPFALPGMEAATERLARAIADGETVLVHGDYDVDGVTGTALLVKLLELVGAEVRWHIPNRLVDGYSFGPHSLARAEETGATVVVSVDNGTSAHTTIRELAERGVDTVVTDHHEAPPGPLPEAAAIVNPKLPGSTYPWRELCGGAVAFKLAWGLCQHLSGGRRARPDLKDFLEEATALVAIATVCDVVPLLDENRVFARFGLKALEAARSPGLAALLKVAGLGGRALDAEDVGFQIGPRLNASGRLGGADVAVDLLLARDPGRAADLAARLDELNVQRKAIERSVLEEARAAAARHADDPVLVLAGQGWHQGVVGIVAARLVEEMHRPALVIGLDGETGRGSARTYGDVDVLAILREGGEHMERFGGHVQAAGCEVRADRVDALRAALCAGAGRHGAPGRPLPLEPDLDLPLDHVNPTLMAELEALAPFGPGNEPPLLLSRGLHLEAPPRRVGADAAHLILRLRRDRASLKAIAFGMGERAEGLALGDVVDVVHTPIWNTFRGERSLELRLHDLRPHVPDAERGAPAAGAGGRLF